MSMSAQVEKTGSSAGAAMTVDEFVATRVQPEFHPVVDMLRGNAKHARYVRLTNPESTNQEALRYYIQQSIELDSL